MESFARACMACAAGLFITESEHRSEVAEGSIHLTSRAQGVLSFLVVFEQQLVVQEIEHELQEISLPRLRDLTERIKQGKTKALWRGFDKLQESKRKFEHERLKLSKLEWKLKDVPNKQNANLRELECRLHYLECEIKLNLEEIERLQQEILVELQKFWLALSLLVLVLDCIEGANQDGGFKNLLLDGWWLEFWEIILLAAGDVERNPGPRQITDEQLAEVSDTPINEDDLSLVYGTLLPVSAKWSMICCCLGLRASLVDTIEMDHPRDANRCLFQGLKQWILKNYDTNKHGLPSWRRLVEAVDDSCGGHNHALALEIAEKHKVQNDPTCVATRSRKDIHDIEREDLVKRHHQSAAFSRMFSSITRLLGRSVKVADLKQFLRYFSNPLLPSQRYVDPGIYEGTKSRRAKDILDRLYPDYINPENTFLLEEIVRNFGSLQSKKCLEKYTSEYH